MCWNAGYERKRFEEKLKKQREEYKKHGMSDAKIEEIEKKDWEIYRSDRRFYSHTQPLEIDDDFENETKNPMLFHFVSNFSDCLTPDYSNKYWWVSEIEDERIIALLSILTDEELTIITLLVFEKCSQTEICEICGLSKYAVHRRVEGLRRKFSRALQRKVGDIND